MRNAMTTWGWLLVLLAVAGGFTFGPDGSPAVGEYVGYATLLVLAAAAIVWSLRRDSPQRQR